MSSPILSLDVPSSTNLMSLAPEIRLLIFPHAVHSPRPFLIGRVQDITSRSTHGSPRDVFNKSHIVYRNDSPNRPVQPAISRVCRILRKETLPLFYSENAFWLIHNEFEPPREEEDDGARNFDAWVSQTPSRYFSWMTDVALCGYTAWPNRTIIYLNLKDRKVIKGREYAMYGDELEPWPTEELGELQADGDAKSALQGFLRRFDWIFRISQEHVSAPPGISKTRKPAEGWEYDW